MQDFKVQESTTEGKCVAGPCLMTAQAKKTDKIHSLKVKEAMSSVEKSTIEDLQKKDSTLKKCFCSSRKTHYQRKLCWKVLHEEWTTLSEISRDEDGTKCILVSGS